MRSKLERIDAKLFQELNEMQSETLVGGLYEDGPTATAEYTWTPSGSDGKVDVDWAF
jgi:hypothetical protein